MRFLLGLLVAALLAGSVAAAFFLFSGRDEGWRSFDDRASGISLRHPPRWELERLPKYCLHVGPGVLVSNIRGRRIDHPTIPHSCTNQWDLGGLPAGYAVIDASQFSGLSARPADTPMPLDLARFERLPRGPGFAFTQASRDGVYYSVRVWFGASASEADRDAMARVVRSIRFRPA